MLARLLALVRVILIRRDVEDELDEELRFHLEMQALENRRRGMDAAVARDAAANVFGGYERVKEQCRDARGGRFLEMLSQDIRFAVRTLCANPGVSAAAVLTLGLGIGANTAIFSAVNGVLLRPLPYEHDDRLVHVLHQTNTPGEDIGFSPLEMEDYRARNRSFTGLVEYHSMPFNLLGGKEPQRVQTAVVSAAFFEVMGLEPLLGRAFRPREDAIASEPVLILSYAFWQRAFFGDPAIVGRTVEMNDRLHTIIGVLPPAPLAYPNADDVYMPVSSCPFRSGQHWRSDRGARGLTMFGRLREGVTGRQALADLQTIASQLKTAYPGAYRFEPNTHIGTAFLRDELTRDARPTFLVLVGTAALVLLIACANVANLTLAGLVRRDRELALRTALGAGRRRLVRQLLTESTLLALVGGTVGLAFAAAGLDLMISFAARFTPRAYEIAIDNTVLGFTLMLSLVTGLLFGTLPALCRQDVVVALRDGGDRATAGPAGRRARGALIAGQLAVSFMLLIGAGLMLRSLVRLHHVDPGFNPENVVTARLDLNWSKYNRDRPVIQFSERLLARVRSVPGVTHAAIANTFPLNATTPHSNSFQIQGRWRDRHRPDPEAEVRSATSDYFAAVGIRLVRGRLYRDAEDDSDRKVAVINQSLARRYWGAADPIGQRVSDNGGRSWVTIIGIVSDVKHYGLDRGPVGEAYVPWSYEPWRDMRLVIRTQNDPVSIAASLRSIVREIDASQPVTEIQTLQELRREALASPRLTAILLGAFAALALGITITGLAGVVAFSVSQRTREFGVRMILGAEPREVLRMVLREGMAVVAVGLALGVAGALFFTRLLSGLLFEIEPRDPLTFLGVSFVLLTVAAAACLVPARRATLVQPVTALRSI
jgi:putative ABC transport system permease protein